MIGNHKVAEEIFKKVNQEQQIELLTEFKKWIENYKGDLPILFRLDLIEYLIGIENSNPKRLDRLKLSFVKKK